MGIPIIKEGENSMKITVNSFKKVSDKLAIIELDFLDERDNSIMVVPFNYVVCYKDDCECNDYDLFDQNGIQKFITGIKWPTYDSEIGRKIKEFDLKGGII